MMWYKQFNLNVFFVVVLWVPSKMSIHNYFRVLGITSGCVLCAFSLQAFMSFTPFRFLWEDR
jgi:hypothetical protein